MPAEPLKKKQLPIEALYINILGKMNWDSEMVKAFQVCVWEQERRGLLLTVSMLGSPKTPGSNIMLGGVESSLQSAAVVEFKLLVCKHFFCDYGILLICTGKIVGRKTPGKGTLEDDRGKKEIQQVLQYSSTAFVLISVTNH